MQQRISRVVNVDQIFVLIKGRAMHAGNIQSRFGLKRTLGQSLEPFKVCGSEIFLRPKCGQRSDGIKAFQVANPRARLVVVAADKHGAEFVRPGNYFVGVGAISDQVAKIPDHVVSRERGSAGAERVVVRMDVTDDEDAHESAGGIRIVRLTTSQAGESEL